MLVMLLTFKTKIYRLNNFTDRFNYIKSNYCNLLPFNQPRSVKFEKTNSDYNFSNWWHAGINNHLFVDYPVLCKIITSTLKKMLLLND